MSDQVRPVVETIDIRQPGIDTASMPEQAHTKRDRSRDHEPLDRLTRRGFGLFLVTAVQYWETSRVRSAAVANVIPPCSDLL